MSRYHVRVMPEKTDTILYLADRYRESQDGPFTVQYAGRKTWGTPAGPRSRVAREVERQPNRVHGLCTFEVVEESDLRVCSHCEKPIHDEPPPRRPHWVDEQGNDICGWGGGDEPHEPI